MQSNFGILGMIQQGYYATYPLLFISVVCLAIIFERICASFSGDIIETSH